MKQRLKAVMRAWDEFWFYSNCPVRVRTFRPIFGTILFFFYLNEVFDLDLFYSDSGILRLYTLFEDFQISQRFSILKIFQSALALKVFHLAFLGSLFSMVVGVFPRISAFLAFLLHISFLNRGMATSYGIDSITTYFLLYLSFFSDRSNGLSSVLSSIAFRFAQIQLCIIYGYSGLEKLGGSLWLKGEAIWTVLANFQIARWDFTWMSHFPVMIAGVTYATVLFELLFPVLIWIRPLRNSFLLAGFLMHLGIAIAMNIPFFAAAMTATYLLFLNPENLIHLNLKLLGRLPMRIMSRLEDFGG